MIRIVDKNGEIVTESDDPKKIHAAAILYQMARDVDSNLPDIRFQQDVNGVYEPMNLTPSLEAIS